ncbi:protein YLS3-like [Durio zibethinus]|uniref:Protein YLS3-like n=1 Tax=Durio zibethinus TaxID=66656 RepID=A0A6P5XY07_DURZI|nr:protein YLS3-like [Durio zibethinus]
MISPKNTTTPLFKSVFSAASTAQRHVNANENTSLINYMLPSLSRPKTGLTLTLQFQRSHYLSKKHSSQGKIYRLELKFLNAMAKLLIMAVLVILGTMATVTDAQATCAQKLLPCYPYLINATAQPQDDCCKPLREAVANDLPCLCNIYSDPNLLASLNITVTEAFRIARECGVTTNLSACNATAPAPTPMSAPPPPGHSGGGNGGADRIALTGITTLFLFLISIAMY